LFAVLNTNSNIQDTRQKVNSFLTKN
jgi:hypothetical protein